MLKPIWCGTIPATCVLRGPPRGAASSSAQRNPGGGSPGFSGSDDRHWGDPIALNIKQHRAPTVHTPPSDFHNLSDHAAIGSISVGSLFLTLQEALDEIEP